MLLSVGIRILSSPSLYASHWAYANTLLVSFVNHYSQLYCSKMVTYNVHGLTRLAHNAHLLGPLDSFSSFPFKNYLGKLKKLVRQPQCVLQQFVYRWREISHRQRSFEIEANSVPKVKKLQASRRLADDEMYFHVTQHGEVQFDITYCYTTQSPNNCVQIGSDIALLKNILNIGKDIQIVYSVFKFQYITHVHFYKIM